MELWTYINNLLFLITEIPFPHNVEMTTSDDIPGPHNISSANS